LAQSSRRDAITCSPACRVRVHRNPSLIAQLKKDAEHDNITVASILQAAAIERLRPDLGPQIMAGSITWADAQCEMARAMSALLRRINSERRTADAAH
jgi:hypothetical protein